MRSGATLTHGRSRGNGGAAISTGGRTGGHGSIANPPAEDRKRRTDVTDFFDRLEDVRARCNVLEHPFYQRWSNGGLTALQLAHYAGEYRHAVGALAAAAASAARAADDGLRPQLEAHAAEEAE